MKPLRALAKQYALVLFVILGAFLCAPGQARAGVPCSEIAHITERSYETFWGYERGDKSVQPGQAIQAVTAQLQADGIDFSAPLEACSDVVKLPYNMLFVYWNIAALDSGPVTEQRLDAVAARLGFLRTKMPLSNLFFATYTRRLVKLYTDNQVAVPADLASWLQDPALAPISGCNMPYFQDAYVVKQVSAVLPPGMEMRGPLTASIEVTIAASGKVVEAQVARSTGILALDNAAMDSAMSSVYSPKMIYCQPMQADYMYRVTFNPL